MRIVNHHEARQILIHRPQPVRHPRADAGKSHADHAGRQRVVTLHVVVRHPHHRTHQRQFDLVLDVFYVEGAAAGLAPHPLAWVKFERETRDPPRVEAALTIHEVGATQRDLFAATAVAGFGMPPPIAAWLREIVGRPGWSCYVSFADDEPAGAGALFIDEDAAWLGIGATKPAFRRRGGQSALIARRLGDAARRGARFAVTETGAPQPGEPAPSHRNILAAGFRAAYVRPNWAFPA